MRSGPARLRKGNAPVHAVDRVLERERALLGDIEVAVLHNLRLNVHAWKRIRVRMGSRRGNKCEDEREDEAAERGKKARRA